MADYRPDIRSLSQSAEWQKYIASGRVTSPPSDSYKGSAIWALKHMQQQLAKVAEEDRSITNYYELATGQKADQSVIDKYSQYAYDPALLAAAIGKATTLAPTTGGFKDKINTIVQETMGRTAKESELESFGKQMEAGNLDAYGLEDFLKGTAEYQTKYAGEARTKLAGELSAADTEYLAKVQKGLEAKYAAAGRPGASAFGSALIGAGKELARERTGYLADIGYQAALGGQESLKAAYQNRLAEMYARQQGTAGLGAESRQRYYSQQDFARQAAAQERLTRLSQPRQGTFLQGLIPGVIQAGGVIGGALISRPAGAAAGGYLGGRLSGGYGYPTRYPGGRYG